MTEPGLHNRLGPRPLPLHLSTAMMSAMSALAALPAVRSGQLPWSKRLTREAAELVADMQEVDLTALSSAVQQEAITRLQTMIDGMRAYQSHRYRRPEPPARILATAGNARLLEYDLDGRGGGEVVPVLIVPSLVNRYYVLDLWEKVSFVRWLAGQGFRPLVVDWGSPGEAEREFDIEDYVAGHLFAFQAAIEAAFARKPHLIGYCMGGNLAVALACLRPAAFASLSLLATPWDFHAERQPVLTPLLSSERTLEPILAAFGEFPVDLLQSIFAALDPNLAQRKFRSFANLDEGADAATTFVALEDWLNDGVSLTPGVARDCFGKWYADNEPMRGRWQVGGQPILPQRLRIPSLVALPANDRIVPPASAAALAAQLPAPERLEPHAGHIGMMVGSKAKTGLWQPLADWLRRSEAQ